MRRLLCFVLCLVSCACAEGSDHEAEAFRAALASGDLERAEDLLQWVEGLDREILRAELTARRAQHERLRARTKDLLDASFDIERSVVKAQLLELRESAVDPVARATVDQALFELEERDHGAQPAPQGSAPKLPAVSVPKPGPYDPELTPEPPPADLQNPFIARHEPSQYATAKPDAAANARLRYHAAQERLRAGDLDGALQAALEASEGVGPGPERDLYTGLARDLEERSVLRVELAEAYAAAGGRELPSGVSAVDRSGVVAGGEELRWSEVPLALLLELVDDLPLSPQARLGLVHERLVAGAVDEAWSELADLHARGLVAAERIASIVARFREEPIPKEGYIFEDGRFVPVVHASAREREERVQRLKKRLVRARSGERDVLVDTLKAEGAREELGAGLELRWKRIAEELAADRTVRKLEKLADERRELDARRAAALELIFDVETYFYPYNPPECPPEKARKYPAVQRSVDLVVEAVREVWARQEPVALERSFRGLLEDAAWTLAKARELALALDDSAVPIWLLAIDKKRERMTLAEFAWTPEEAEDLRRSRGIVAFNRARFEKAAELAAKVAGGEADVEPDLAERRQVEITNDYRILFGRRALVWSPKLQASAADHARYMSDTGDFGHFEPDPERNTPELRARRRGYQGGASENCHAGSGDPMDAHVAWLHSSGHHRNLLDDKHREMGSAIAGSYWTQNFGNLRESDAELAQWLAQWDE